MCLIIFSYKSHPRYNLILAANRDEFYGRPTREAQFWDRHPDLLAGKDLEAGGTWMGINKGGQFSAITNYREPDKRDPGAPTRGKLVLNYLQHNEDPYTYLERINGKAYRYNGFNLLTGNVNRLYYLSNKKEGIDELSSGIYGLSNHLLNTPWPKVLKAQKHLKEITKNESFNHDALFELLADDTKADPDNLPDTGVPPEWEHILSPIFIKSEEYGTRCSTVLTIDKNDQVHFEERTFDPESHEISNISSFEFELERLTDSAIRDK